MEKSTIKCHSLAYFYGLRRDIFKNKLDNTRLLITVTLNLYTNNNNLTYLFD